MTKLKTKWAYAHFFIKFKMLNNRIDSTEIIAIADAVADEKSIDKNLV